MPEFRYESTIPVDASIAYAWHARPGAFERLTPPWIRVDVERRSGTLEQGDVFLVFHAGPLRLRWHARHLDGKPGVEFRDRMLSGPFAAWDHMHRFVSLGKEQFRMEDEVHYRILRRPEFLDPLLDAAVVRSELKRTFAYRHRVLAHDLSWHRELSAKPLRFLVTGASGLIGSTLCPFLSAGGHTVITAVRGRPRSESQVRWNPSTGEIAPPSSGSVDVVVHLAGANVGEGRWTPERKTEIRNSRVAATAKLAEQLARWKKRPQVLIAASAIGFYGNRGDAWMEETSSPGEGFLASVCQEWEAAVQPAEQAGIRVVRLRIGVVLSPRGGALKRLLWPFWLGFGGPTGSGDQFMSWITPDDLAAAILFCAHNQELEGPVNAVAPNPVTNRAFAGALGRALRRPALVPFPAAAVRLVFGEMGEELILSSTRVRPARLLQAGFRFRYDTIDQALSHVLGARNAGRVSNGK
ncbi:MAG: TIGR01777 family oxidoreductase [Candidatus Binatia bacterium]|nr:TIGR01777 family oxidoreductase [Candidatus Binatia bacterium]